MKIYILTENAAGSHFGAEHGISYLIEIDGEKILFDTGHSDMFLKNAGKLNLDIHSDVKKVVLSHGHWDHGNGLQYLKEKILITHPGAFITRFRKRDLSPVGLALEKNQLKKKFIIRETEKSLHISENLFYLGEIPRKNHFEAQTTSFSDELGKDDFVPDDSALVAVTQNKIVVITGCSHSGICNITDYAKKVTGISKIKAVIGGFHLKENDSQTKNTIEYFKNAGVENLFPSHCTELPAMAAFHQNFGNSQVKTGMIFEF